VLTQLKAEYPDELRVIYRHFPLASIHDKALLSTQAAEAAGLQGKFWEMHDFLYGNLTEWSGFTEEQFQSWLLENVTSLGLDSDQFETAMNSDELASLAQKTWDDGQAIGLPGTPFLVINGTPYDGPVDAGNLAAIIQLSQLNESQFSECPPVIIDPLKQYVATLKMEAGDIVVELFPDIAPLAVNSFVFLAQEGWFDGISFHRVVPDFVAQAGDPTGTGLGGPGYAFKNETSPELVFDRAGLLAMANAGPDTNGSQFFITYGPAAHLNGSYTIFGEVLEGMDVVNALTPRDPSQSMGLPSGDVILGVDIEER
jgi:cyclophilin family peptidyl-prolyl cis-trans isomerase